METSAESDKQQSEEEELPAPAPVAEAAQPAEEVSRPKKPLKRLHGRQKGQRKAPRPTRKRQPTLQQVKDLFAACGRCSYFWAGYRVIFGEEALDTAVANSQSSWLDLEWNLEMPELVVKSYGVRLDITHYHYEGCCLECRRPFVYQAAEDEEEAAAFHIAITPRVTQ